MRLSIIKGDPGYVSDMEAARWRVFIDGRQVFTAETVDTELGLIKHITRHRNPLTRQVLTRRWDEHGVVEIKPK